MNEAGSPPSELRPKARVVRDLADAATRSAQAFPTEEFPHVRIERISVPIETWRRTDRRSAKHPLYEHALKDVEGVIVVGGHHNSGLAASLAEQRGIPVVPVGAFGGVGERWHDAISWEFQEAPAVRAHLPDLRSPWTDSSAAAVLGCLHALRAHGRFDRNTPRVFISYRQSTASDLAELLERELEQTPAVRPWLDVTDLPDARSTASIKRSVAQSAVLVCLIDDGWRESPHCQEELHEARSKEVPVIPLLIDGEVPDSIHEKAVRISDGGRRQALQRVAIAAEELARQPR